MADDDQMIIDDDTSIEVAILTKQSRTRNTASRARLKSYEKHHRTDISTSKIDRKHGLI
jgi:hypothetical protein